MGVRESEKCKAQEGDAAALSGDDASFHADNKQLHTHTHTHTLYQRGVGWAQTAQTLSSADSTVAVA